MSLRWLRTTRLSSCSCVQQVQVVGAERMAVGTVSQVRVLELLEAADRVGAMVGSTMAVARKRREENTVQIEVASDYSPIIAKEKQINVECA